MRFLYGKSKKISCGEGLQDWFKACTSIVNDSIIFTIVYSTVGWDGTNNDDRERHN